MQYYAAKAKDGVSINAVAPVDQIADLENWTMMPEEFVPPETLQNTNGQFLYKLAPDGKGLALQTEQELLAQDWSDLVSLPTQLDRVEAQIAYTAMMTGTLLEG